MVAIAVVGILAFFAWTALQKQLIRWVEPDTQQYEATAFGHAVNGSGYGKYGDTNLNWPETPAGTFGW